MKTSKFTKLIRYAMILVLAFTGITTMTSCLDLGQLTQSKDKIVAVVKTTDQILASAIVSLDTVITVVKGTAVEDTVTQTVTKVKTALTFVKTALGQIAKLLQIDLTAGSAQDNADLDELVKRLKQQLGEL